MKNGIFHCVVERGGGEKSGGAHKFSLLSLQNTISPNWRENLSEKWEKYLDKIALTFFFFSFFFFFLNFYFYYFFKKTFLDDFLYYFLKCSFSSIHNFFKKYNVLLFVLFKRDMMVNLYKPYFQPNLKNFHPSTFPPSQPNTNEEK